MQYRLHIKRFGPGFWSFHTPMLDFPNLPYRSLFDNALVSGIDKILTQYERKYGKFDVIISDEEICCESVEHSKLTWAKGDRYNPKKGGNWYSTADGKLGWLCPVLFDYYNPCPSNIYAYIVKYQRTPKSRITVGQWVEELKIRFPKNNIEFLEAIDED